MCKFILLFIAAAVLSSASPLWAQGSFDIYQYCRDQAESLNMGYSYEESCRKREESASREMAGRSIPYEINRYCSEQAEFLKMGYSYMWSCVEREMAAKDRLGY